MIRPSAKTGTPAPGDFVAANTAVARLEFLPEIRLRAAADVAAVWEKVEAAYGGGRPTPYWAVPWVGGQALARHLIDRPEAVAGRRVFDFGAGGGICAIAAALAGAATVVASDSDPLARAATAINAALNGVGVEPADAPDLGRDLDGIDVVLAGDVWYERQLAERATPWLRRQAAAGRDVLVGDMRRAYFPRAGVELIAEFEVPTSTDTEQSALTRAYVWRLSA